MAAKQVLISADDITYYLLPGGSGEVTREGVVIDDTIFGQLYKSGITGPISWAINANAIYKGYPGYKGVVNKPGTSTPTTGEAMTLVSGKTYQINDTAKRVWNRAASWNVLDNAVNRDAEIESIDWLTGQVTFKSTYTVVAPVTMDVSYYPLASLGKYTGFTLTMTADPIRDSNIPALIANNGYHMHSPGLKTVALELPMVFLAT